MIKKGFSLAQSRGNMEAENMDVNLTERTGSGRAVRLQQKRSLNMGIDIGSTSSDIVLMDADNRVVFSDYRRTKGRPIETLAEQLTEIFQKFHPSHIRVTAAGGSAGRFAAEIAGIDFVNEVCAQAAAIGFLYPGLSEATLIEMGGQDSKLIFLESRNGRLAIKDFSLNTACAAGTGSFLDQQAERLGVNIEEEFGRLALACGAVPSLAGRCSVFAKSDMIHLQQQATPVCDIIAGLCVSLARGLKSNLGCGRTFAHPVIFTGGVAANAGVVRAFEQVFELPTGGIIVPRLHFFTGAIGAVLSAAGGKDICGTEFLSRIEKYLSSDSNTLTKAPRLEPLKKPSSPAPRSPVYDSQLKDGRIIDAYLGVDVGSISTNVVVMDPAGRVLAKEYLMTAGRPIEAVKKGLEQAACKVAGKVRIAGAATTGSGRYLTGDFIGADIVINEITAQAAGAAIVNPGVDTIFEIGGQDSKYISLENGVVVDFEMNHACAAGTGSFLEEQAQRLGININGQFSELAFKSVSPIKLGERCTVFMESDLLSYQQQGASVEDLVAGLGYSIAVNYLNRVVGRHRVGENICFQGGTAFNHAVWSAFEAITGKKIMVPDHHEVTGALGAAWIAAEHIRKSADENGVNPESRFRGFGRLVNMNYEVESFDCTGCANGCQVKKVRLEGSEPFYYGCRCDRYNTKKDSAAGLRQDAFEFRHKKMMACAGFDDQSRTGDRPGMGKVGIPLALVNWQYLPLFSQFFKALGFDVVISGRTNRRLIKAGVESVGAQTCFPVKVAFGHVDELIEKGVDYIFIPSIVSATDDYAYAVSNQLCPYVQSFPYQVKSSLNGRLGKVKLLTAALRLGDGPEHLRKSFIRLAEELAVSGGKIKAAIRRALAAQKDFADAMRAEGTRILSELRPGEKLFVLVSRPYNGCDDGVNLQLGQKLAGMNVRLIPMEMLDVEGAVSQKELDEQLYWRYGRKILRAGEIIRDDPRLFAIYLSNFGCGPDSFILAFFRDVMGKKPSLALELDEHSADAGLITRLEAFLESLRNYKEDRRLEMTTATGCPGQKTSGSDSMLFIPYMGDCAYGMAACFRAYGQAAQVMPVADETVLLKGRRFTSGKECLPCALTAGEMLNTLSARKDSNCRYLFFMPTTSGPCRFGMYNCLQKMILRYAGAENVLIISPNQSDDFYSQLGQNLNGRSGSSFMKDIWAATVGIDLLGKLLLRLRPFAKDGLIVQKAYDRAMAEWVKLVENRPSVGQMCELMEKLAVEFGSIELDNGRTKPRIGIVGEIYVRNHPFANNSIVDRLEKLGAACEVAPVAEWIYYTNVMRGDFYGRRGMYIKRLVNSIQNHLQHRIEKAIAAPLEKKFGTLSEKPVEHLLELALPYLHHSFEGEAVLSAGKIIEYYQAGMGGVVNVMPFGCMPSTIVSTQTSRISTACNGMPVLNISFDGQEDPSLMTRLEAFVGQVLRKNIAAAECVY